MKDVTKLSLCLWATNSPFIIRVILDMLVNSYRLAFVAWSLSFMLRGRMEKGQRLAKEAASLPGQGCAPPFFIPGCLAFLWGTCGAHVSNI